MTQDQLSGEYVLARRVLLDALSALGPHCDAVVLVGAQAVYLHTGNTDLAVAPTTTDADIALTPDRLHDKPLLEDALRAAGFTAGTNPGTWRGAFGVAVDLMVPEALSGPKGRRGARLPAHGNRVARRTAGLEPAIVDNEKRELTHRRPTRRSNHPEGGTVPSRSRDGSGWASRDLGGSSGRNPGRSGDDHRLANRAHRRSSR